ncbi:MAG TPA: hypothetical protein PLU54_08640 [Deltaproteobacteria bacterium]|nr:hypothetical protein [Deltaproteobacteria bacterium]
MTVSNRLTVLIHTLSFTILLVLLLISSMPASLQAQMLEVNDEDLSQVTAQAGIQTNWDAGVRVWMDSYAFSDTDNGNWIELNDVKIKGTQGSDYFSMQTPELNTLDVATTSTIDSQLRTYVNYHISDMMNPRNIEVGEFKFCGQNLGSFEFDSLRVSGSDLRISHRRETGSCGVELDLLTQITLDSIKYDYNTSGGTLEISGLYLTGAASGAGDDPSDPSTWEFSGRFRFGDLLGGEIDDPTNPGVPNPVTYDVATVGDTTDVFMNIPMKGTARAESVNFGGTGFGPVAIDGITVHHLYIRTISGN